MRHARRSFIVNGYPDGELAGDQLDRHERRRLALARWQRMLAGKRLRRERMEAAMKLRNMDPIALLDFSYAAQDLFDELPRLPPTDQATLVDYVEMRLEMWRKANGPATGRRRTR